MRYKDNKFLNYQEKQRNGEVGGYWSNKSDRMERRELETALTLFYQRYLINKIEKEWWLTLSIDDKKSIRRSYTHQEFMLEQNDLEIWSNEEFFDTWEEWYEYILKEYKPDMSKYRELKLKKLGI
jgi:hypothetical protein